MSSEDETTDVQLDISEYEEQKPIFEVVWLCEPDEENWDGILGAGMYEPRPNFYTEHDAMSYIKNERLRSRAIIFYHELDDDGELYADRHITVRV